MVRFEPDRLSHGLMRDSIVMIGVLMKIWIWTWCSLLQSALVIQIGKLEFISCGCPSPNSRGKYFHINRRTIEQIVQQEWIVAGVG